MATLTRARLAGCTLMLWCGLLDPSWAFVVAVAPAARLLYLQVGTGTMSGGPYASGGQPRDNATINRVAVAVAPALLGTGAVQMTSNSAVAASSYDGFIFCTPPAQVYVAGLYRRTGGGGSTATLSVTTPAALTSAAADTIPFDKISWVSSGIGDATPTIPSGRFTGGSQTLLTIGRNLWFESCLTFSYDNDTIFPAGTFGGRAIYLLSAP